MPLIFSPEWLAAKASYERGQFRMAFSQFTQVKNEHPELVLHYLGLLHLEFGEYHQAHHHFLDYLLLDPKCKITCLGLYLSYLKLGQSSLAAKCLQHIGDIDSLLVAKNAFTHHAPDFIRLIDAGLSMHYLNLANTAYTENNQIKVRQLCKSVIELDPNNIDAYHLRIISLLFETHYQTALIELCALLQKSLTNQKKWQLCELFIDSYEKALVLGCKLTLAIDLMAVKLYNENRRYRDAHFVITNMLRDPASTNFVDALNEEMVTACMGIAEQLRAVGDFEKARKCYLKILDVSAGNKLPIHLKIATTYEHERNYDRALQIYGEILQKQHNDEEFATIKLCIKTCQQLKASDEHTARPHMK